MKLRPSDLAVIAAMAVMTLIAGNEILGRVLDDGPQTSPAIITEPTPRTVVIAPVESTAVSTTSTTPATSTTTAHDALQADLAIPILDPSVPCQQWAPLALKIGWPEDELVNVLEEMWQESRCLNIIPGTDQWNGGDHGLMQINTVWKDEVEHLFGSWERINDPEVNLAMALEIWRWHDAHRGCGWEPWSRPC